MKNMVIWTHDIELANENEKAAPRWPAHLKRMMGGVLLDWITTLFTYTARTQEQEYARMMRDRAHRY